MYIEWADADDGSQVRLLFVEKDLLDAKYQAVHTKRILLSSIARGSPTVVIELRLQVKHYETAFNHIDEIRNIRKKKIVLSIDKMDWAGRWGRSQMKTTCTNARRLTKNIGKLSLHSQKAQNHERRTWSILLINIRAKQWSWETIICRSCVANMIVNLAYKIIMR